MRTTERYAKVAGTRIEALGRIWAAYSPMTGETALLNDESAAMLEVLEAGPGDTASLCAALSADSGQDLEALQSLIDAAWVTLREAGLVIPTTEPTTFQR